MNDIAKQYEELIGQAPRQAVLDRLTRISKTIGVSENDALWGILLGLEFYDRLFEEHPKKLREALVSLHQEVPIQGWLWICVAIAGIVVLGSICFLAGLSIGGGEIPPWWSNNGLPGAITAVLRTPAGWILLLAGFPWVAKITWDCFQAQRKKSTQLLGTAEKASKLTGLPTAIAVGTVYIAMVVVIIAITL